MKQLRHLDIFINATIYQLPYKVFDYLYSTNDKWMMNDINDTKLAEHIQILNDTNYRLNDSQQSAIAKSLIYPISLIQGPPGTGKTYTLSHLCSIILTNGLKQDYELIIITAHSHAACDRILEVFENNNNLKSIVKTRISRFGAVNKIRKDLAKKYSFKIRMKKHKQYKEYLKFLKCGYKDQARDTLHKLARSLLMDEIDIVITTCYGCCNQLLMNIDVPISHLIIDEATQIVETELLIAVIYYVIKIRGTITKEKRNQNYKLLQSIGSI